MLLALGLLASCGALVALAVLAWRWLAKSWHVVEDERLPGRLGSPEGIIQSWFGLRPRRLTYRRDARGRFRRHRR